MSAHVHLTQDRLIDLALDEVAEPAERAHMDSCAQCLAEIEEWRRTALTAQTAGDGELVAPPAAVWARIDAAVEAMDADEPADDGVLARPVTSKAAWGRVEAPRHWRGWLAAAAVVGVLAGSGITATVSGLRERTDAPTAPTVVARADLATLDTRQRMGRAALEEVGDDLVLDLRLTEAASSQDLIEVWLINTDGQRMVSLGLVPEGRTAERFSVSRALLDEGYVLVDVSREPLDGIPTHSGDSLMRGELTT